MKNVSLIGFLVFLCIYSYFKYTAVPSLMGTTLYMISTAILVILTAIVPYFLTRVLTTKVAQPRKKWVLSFSPLVLSALGLALYFYLFIAPNAPGMSVLQILPRSILPGVVISLLLLGPSLINKRTLRPAPQS